MRQAMNLAAVMIDYANSLTSRDYFIYAGSEKVITNIAIIAIIIIILYL